MNLPLIASIDALLPQTQCGQCGYAGCKPYASAISINDAQINQCPPGGDAVIQELADLLDVPYLPLNPQHGEHKAKLLAVIDESACIGCTLCIAACPVDAIIGSFRLMHSVIAVECTGCELCIAPCPVDCISLIPAVNAVAANTKNAANLARERYEHRLLRHARQKNARLQKRQLPASLAPDSGVVHASLPVDIQYKDMASPDIKKAAMMAALAKAVLLKKNALSKKTHQTTVLQQNTNMAQLPAVDQE